jgi:hypothetical protein
MSHDNTFFRYPRIAHIAGSKHTSDDIILGDIPKGTFIVFEKTDGANTGVGQMQPFQYTFQNRGEYIQNKRKHEQWDALFNYVNHKCLEFNKTFENVEQGSILFGEWLYAVHSVVYDNLPDHFIIFDIWQPSTGLMNSYHDIWNAIHNTGLTVVKEIAVTSSIEKFLKTRKERPKSQFGNDKMEGYIFRNVDNYNEVYKYVYPEFTNGITSHWFNTELRRNKVK